MTSSSQEKCCPRLEAGDWDKQRVEWRDKTFYKTKYRTLFHIPLNIGSVLTRAMKDVEGRGIGEDPELMLSLEDSLFSSTLLLSIAEAPQDLPVERVSGTFVTRLFEGSYRNVKRWCDEVRQSLRDEGHEAQRLLFWYVTCPRCAKKYGGAQTVIFAQVA